MAGTPTFYKKGTKVCENKETDSPSGIYRMKLLGTCSLLKETPEKNGTPIFWEWDSYFLGVGLLLFGWDSYFL